ncbi:MAG: 30S ribosome-binding factor RbfA [Planctomycetes bacterium]|nr:30S ribosome-binding factor RbfA [Planctomycetota bacterium]
MADDRRIQRIQSRIRQDVAELFLAELKDPRMRGLISITRVKVSKDLTNARVYYSVLGSDSDKRTVERFIESVTPMVQRHVVEGLKIRVAPRVIFTYDDSIAKQESVSKLIDQALASDRKAATGRQADSQADSEE